MLFYLMQVVMGLPTTLFFSIQGFIATSLWPLGLRFGGPADRIVVFLKFDSLIMNIIEDLMVWEWMTID